jgi:hypothetical protein
VFGRTDDVVRDAAAQKGLKPVLTVVGAPRWAEGKNPPSGYRVGSWKPNPKRFGQFGAALARRYSGKFRDSSGRLLPRIRFYEAWNEPNLPRYLSPQWKGKEPKAPNLYRRLLNEFYEGVHSVDDSNKVIAGGTSPFGDDPGGKRMRPYYFWRQVLCLKNRKKLKKKSNCVKEEDRAHFDIYAHNPINGIRGKGPTSKSPNPDDGVPSNFEDLGRIVPKAEQRETILPSKKGRPGWATETWYESNPPDRKAVSLRKQAAFMQQALYVLWKQRAGAVFFLQMRDSDYDPNVHPLLGFQTGVYFFDDTPKPSLRAVRFPFVVDRRSKQKAVLWGKAPRSGRLKVVQKGRGPRKVAEFQVERGGVFKKKVKLPRRRGRHSFQARIGSRKRLQWEQK